VNWPQTLALVGLLIAIGKFLDTYHGNARLELRIVDWIRTLLVRLFIALESIQLIQIARRALRVPIWLVLLVLALSALGVFLAGSLIYAFLTVFGKQTYPPEVLPLTAGFAVLLQALVFLAMRMLARWAPDWIATIALIALPVLFVGAMTAPIEAAADHPGLSGLWLAIYLTATLVSSAIPIVVVLLSALLIMVLKYVTLLIRFVLMKIAEGASSPSVSPFAYMSGLSAVTVLSWKTLIEFW